MNALNPSAITEQLAARQHWQHDAERGAITRRFTFSNFIQAFAFMTEIAIEAEKRNHHPEWSNVYKRVDILLTTHDVGGLSDKDFSLAKVCDDAFSRYQT